MKEVIRIDYDDSVDSSAYDAISAANNLLEPHGLSLDIEDDNELHDGYIKLIITLNANEDE
jgi:hypothetical protein